MGCSSLYLFGIGTTGAWWVPHPVMLGLGFELPALLNKWKLFTNWAKSLAQGTDISHLRLSLLGEVKQEEQEDRGRAVKQIAESESWCSKIVAWLREPESL